MNTLAWLAGVACLVWAAVAISRRLDRPKRQGQR